MSAADEQNKGRAVTDSAKQRRKEERGREDPTEPDEVGSAKETTVRERMSHSRYGASPRNVAP
jgi:hypothetical protein